MNTAKESTMRPPPQPQNVNEFDISGLEAMLAGTLCLMSAYSHSAANNGSKQSLIGLKIVSNLTCLQCQSCLSPEFRRVLSKVCESWRRHSLLTSSRHAQETSSLNHPCPHWHSAPSTLQ
jgi:hypothetical protein